MQWNTLIFNFGRNEVRNFMISSALFWLEEYHIDGLRVDAVASKLYRDFGREHTEWLPNHLGGRENLEAIEFLQELNSAIASEHPDVFTVAEESTCYSGVTHPVRPDRGRWPRARRWWDFVWNICSFFFRYQLSFHLEPAGQGRTGIRRRAEKPAHGGTS